MFRSAVSELIRWKNRPCRKPLLVTGVRQCGKTYLIRQFGESEFENVAYLNFDGNDRLSSVFEHDLDTRRILSDLESLIIEKTITDGKTLLIFDEIQACPRAIQSLKYFCENEPELHLIAAGSLLGVALRSEGVSFPVGKVDRLEMYPMSFEEFVIADGGSKYIDAVKRTPLDRELPELITHPLEKYLFNYYIVGGMPEAVQTWVNTHNYNETDEVLDRILKDYADDFGKHAAPETAAKIRLIWDAIPGQIARDNSKFVFSHVKQGARSKDLEDALAWLVNAGIACKLDLVMNPEVPLSSMADSTYFKVYLSDVGLLRKKSNLNHRIILNDDPGYVHFKGALAENYVLTQLNSLGISSYFWRAKANAELDFITDHEGLLLPIEVKSADNTKAKSLHLFCSRYRPTMAIKSSLKNVSDNMDGNTHVWSLPLYTLFRIKQYIADALERRFPAQG